VKRKTSKVSNRVLDTSQEHRQPGQNIIAGNRWSSATRQRGRPSPASWHGGQFDHGSSRHVEKC